MWSNTEIKKLREVCDGTHTMDEIVASFPERHPDCIGSMIFRMRKSGYDMRIKRKREINPQRGIDVQRLLDEGYSAAQIAKMLGLTSPNLCIFIKKHLGIDRNGKSYWNEERVNVLLHMWEVGTPLSEIAAYFSKKECAIQTKMTELRRHGYNVPKKWEVKKEIMTKHSYPIVCINKTTKEVWHTTAGAFKERYHLRSNAVTKACWQNKTIRAMRQLHSCQGWYVFYESDYKLLPFAI